MLRWEKHSQDHIVSLFFFLTFIWHDWNNKNIETKKRLVVGSELSRAWEWEGNRCGYKGHLRGPGLRVQVPCLDCISINIVTAIMYDSSAHCHNSGKPRKGSWFLTIIYKAVLQSNNLTKSRQTKKKLENTQVKLFLGTVTCLTLIVCEFLHCWAAFSSMHFIIKP